MGIVIKLSKPILKEYGENRFLKNWLTFLVLVAFIRLQFCCCGSIDHGNFELLTSASPSVSCPAEAKCQCSFQHAKPKTEKQAESKSVCGRQLCNHDHSHVPHLATEHVLIVSSPNVNLASLIVQQSLPIAALASSNDSQSRSSGRNEKCLHKGISILCEFGHLRI